MESIPLPRKGFYFGAFLLKVAHELDGPASRLPFRYMRYDQRFARSKKAIRRILDDSTPEVRKEAQKQLKAGTIPGFIVAKLRAS